jgi:hypothetical protein
VWSFERGYHIAGNAFGRRKAGRQTNGEKVDFVAVRKCVSSDIAGFRKNSNCVIVRSGLFGRGMMEAEEDGGLRKNREIFAIRNS